MSTIWTEHPAKAGQNEALMSMDETLNNQTPYDRAQWQAQRAMEAALTEEQKRHAALAVHRMGPWASAMPWDRTIRELREENARLRYEAAQRYIHGPQYNCGGYGCGHQPCICNHPVPQGVQLPASDDPVVGESVVDNVVDALNRRVVPPPDRTRLRDALDKADAPQTGRAGADEALGRAIRFGGSNAA